MRSLPPFGESKVPGGARLVLRSLSPGLNAPSDGGLRGEPPDPAPAASVSSKQLNLLPRDTVRDLSH